MYFPLLKKRKLGENNKFIILLLGLIIIIGFFVLYFFLYKKEESIMSSKSLYIEEAAKEFFNIDYTQDAINDYKFSDNYDDANIIISDELKDNFKVIEKINVLYVVVVSWENYSFNNINYEDILDLVTNNKNINLNGDSLEFVYFDSYKDDYKNIFNDNEINIKSYKSIKDIESYKSDKNFISLIRIDDMKPYFKSLTVNEVSPYTKSVSDYKLSSDYFLQTDSENEDKTISFLKNEIEIFNTSSKVTEILAVGDIMLSRDVGIKIRKSGDYSLPFRKLHGLLSAADITFGNLESPFYDKGPPLDLGMSFKADPKYIEGLVLSGFDVLSLANNHFGNQGREGMEYTFNHLANNGIKYCGAGMNYKDAHESVEIKKNGLNFSFVSYNLISPQSYKALDDTPGLAFISNNEESLSKMSGDIKREKEKNNIVIASFHWGVEYVPNPTDLQKKVARIAIESGADIIISQHPHVVQAIEFIEGKPVLYSLGNFVFDQMWSSETREGMMAKVFLSGNKIVSFELFPVIIEDYNQPRLATEDESNKIINRVIVNSDI
jgi:poly-gamma-glutamate synthesis protein (capsule biosynthesis protein)